MQPIIHSLDYAERKKSVFRAFKISSTCVCVCACVCVCVCVCACVRVCVVLNDVRQIETGPVQTLESL